MKKVFRTILSLTLVFVFLFPYLLTPYMVDAADNRTIKSILEDIEKQKKELEENKNKQQLTNEQITNIKNNISLIDSQIKEGNEQIIKLNNEIAELEVEIENKEEEIKKIVNFLQISSGESEYMEYIFGAQNFTDFIYRLAITEQVTDYNDKLVEEFNEMIETNKRRQEDIRKKEQELTKKQEELQNEISKLTNQVASLSTEQGDIEDGLKKSEDLVNGLIDLGCKETETIDACYTRINSLPVDTEFWRPLESGSISSLFGWRSYWYNGQYVTDYHYGLDISVPTGTPVYAVANGQAKIKAYWPGTGYTLYVYHNINGVKYTSVYEHLHAYNVNENQYVTKDTIIAYAGNTGASTGPHLHLSILKGWAGLDYSLWGNEYYISNVDPKTKINFPAGYGSFYTRTRNCSKGSC